jgi:hypothetical protein
VVVGEAPGSLRRDAGQCVALERAEGAPPGPGVLGATPFHGSPAAEALVHAAVALTAGADDGAAGDVAGREEAAAVVGTGSRPETLKYEVLQPPPLVGVGDQPGEVEERLVGGQSCNTSPLTCRTIRTASRSAKGAGTTNGPDGSARHVMVSGTGPSPN